MSATIELAYYLRNWQFRCGIDWIDGMDSYAYLEEDPATSVYDFATDDYTKHYMSVRYTTDRWEITGGVRNIFDEEPRDDLAGLLLPPRQRAALQRLRLLRPPGVRAARAAVLRLGWHLESRLREWWSSSAIRS